MNPKSITRHSAYLGGRCPSLLLELGRWEFSIV